MDGDNDVLAQDAGACVAGNGPDNLGQVPMQADGGAAEGAGPDSTAPRGEAQEPPAAANKQSSDLSAVLLNCPPVDNNLPSDLATLELQKEALQRQAALFSSQARGRSSETCIFLRDVRLLQAYFLVRRARLPRLFLVFTPGEPSRLETNAGASARPRHQEADGAHWHATPAPRSPVSCGALPFSAARLRPCCISPRRPCFPPCLSPQGGTRWAC